MCNVHTVIPIGRPVGKRELDLMHLALASGAVANKDAHGVFNERGFNKALGNKVKRKFLKDFEGSEFIVGHNRLATSGVDALKNAHPFKVGAVTVAHNGIVNGLATEKKCDTLVLTEELSNNYDACGSPVKALKKTIEAHPHGSYSVFAWFSDANTLLYFRSSGANFKFGLFESARGLKTILGSTYLSNFKVGRELLGFVKYSYPLRLITTLEPEENVIYEVGNAGIEAVGSVQINKVYYAGEGYSGYSPENDEVGTDYVKEIVNGDRPDIWMQKNEEW